MEDEVRDWPGLKVEITSHEAWLHFCATLAGSKICNKLPRAPPYGLILMSEEFFSGYLIGCRVTTFGDQADSERKLITINVTLVFRGGCIGRGFAGLMGGPTVAAIRFEEFEALVEIAFEAGNEQNVLCEAAMKCAVHLFFPFLHILLEFVLV